MLRLPICRVTIRVEPDHQPNRPAKLEDVAEGMVALAVKLDAVVVCRFDSIELRATPDSKPEEIVQSFRNTWAYQGRIG